MTSVQLILAAAAAVASDSHQPTLLLGPVGDDGAPNTSASGCDGLDDPRRCHGAARGEPLRDWSTKTAWSPPCM